MDLAENHDTLILFTLLNFVAFVILNHKFCQFSQIKVLFGLARQNFSQEGICAKMVIFVQFEGQIWICVQWRLLNHSKPKHVIFVSSIAQNKLVFGEKAVRVCILKLGKVDPHTARLVFKVVKAVLFLGKESIDPNSLNSANSGL